MKRLAGDKRGFTILEIIVAVTLTGIATAAIYKSFSAQQSVYTVQGQVVDMQQNLRAGTDLMLRELRMAGCDPTANSVPGFKTATATSVRFTSDLDGNGDVSGTEEDITYSLGTASGVPCLLRQRAGESASPVAENIEHIEFYYTLADGSSSLTPTDLTKIRSIQITLLARSATKDKISTTYNAPVTPGATGAGWAMNDGYRRRLSTFTVKCRNMGFRS